VNLKLDIKPISINTCWAGRRFKTPKYTQYEKDIYWLLQTNKYKPEQEISESERIAVVFTFHLKSILKGDIDNPVKPLLDLLVKNGFIKDDRYIMALHIYKVKAEKDSVEIEIMEQTNV